MDLGQNVKLYQFNRVLYNAFSFICTNFETTVSLSIETAYLLVTSMATKFGFIRTDFRDSTKKYIQT